MIKAILAIAAAAVCAGIVVLAPEVAPKSAMAGAMASTVAATRADEFVPVQEVVAAIKNEQSDRGCLQHWPYYEQSCLRDGHQPSGSERVVRVIAFGRTGAQ